MPCSSGILPILYPSIINRNTHKTSLSGWRTSQRHSTRCRAASSSSFSITDYDLYDLLGVDSSSNQSQIKNAYRSLQKRCHPDIAGPAGHDMAIILNDAYAVLSDPNSRFAYDMEQAKVAELRGYTGNPVYSVWYGSEAETRAVFVDEVKCVGCLKCALLAEKTFAIECAYGRARVVAQWADPENKIQDAIEACPVDCISIVDRENLAALEFLMSKQPRSSVRMCAGNTVGTRVSNIFADVKKFQTRFHQMKSKVASSEGPNSKESDLHRATYDSAMQAIRAISNWLYWQSPGREAPQSYRSILYIPEKKTVQPNAEGIREAAAKRMKKERIEKQATQNHTNNVFRDEYWTPARGLPHPPESSNVMAVSNSLPTRSPVMEKSNNKVKDGEKWENPLNSTISVAMGTIAATIVGFESGGNPMDGGLEEHVGGSMVLEIVNSSVLQAALAGITWYIVGATILGLVQAFAISMRK